MKKNNDGIWISLVKDEDPFLYIHKEDIIKNCKDIISLVEVGDYVNGVKVDFTNIKDKLSYEDKCIGFYNGDGDITLFENDIKTILTKEQFESMEYKVGELDER